MSVRGFPNRTPGIQSAARQRRPAKAPSHMTCPVNVSLSGGLSGRRTRRRGQEPAEPPQGQRYIRWFPPVLPRPLFSRARISAQPREGLEVPGADALQASTMGHLSANILHQAEARGAGTTSLPSDRNQEPFAQAGPAWDPERNGRYARHHRQPIFLSQPSRALAGPYELRSTRAAAAHAHRRPAAHRHGAALKTPRCCNLLLTGVAASDGTGHLSHLGAETVHCNLTLTLTGTSTFQLHGHENLRGGERRTTKCSRLSPGRGRPRAPPPRPRRQIRSPVVQAASPEPAGRIRTRSASWSSRSPRRSRQAASPLLSKDRSATRPSTGNPLKAWTLSGDCHCPRPKRPQ